MEEIDRITGEIIGCAMRIHSRLGPGLYESVYEVVLARDLVRRGLYVERQKAVSFEFDGMYFDEGFRADLVVEDCVIVELKSVSALAPVHARQLLTYLRLMDLRIGLLINFSAVHLRDGLKRVLNAWVPAASRDAGGPPYPSSDASAPSV